MIKPSTFYNMNTTKFVSNKFKIGYSFIATKLLTDEQSTSNSLLQWVPNQEVVLLPKITFYTKVGKRLVDIAVATFTCVFILSWLIPLLGTLLLTESKGPILFIQTRSGRKGKPFRCLKFRTMRKGPELQHGFRQTDQNDSRVTTLGRFLRRTNLDEMPQFINVMLGDMSLVGPRPHARPHDALHWTSSAYRERYWVRPGITGLAQVRGSRGATSNSRRMEHRVRYDHLYISRQTFMLDMKICYETLRLMFKGDRNAC